MPITKDMAVAIDYKLTVDGEVVDASPKGEPLLYLAGHHNIIPGLEAALDGKETGDQVEAVIQPADAYGTFDANLQINIPLDAFPPEHREQLAPGVQFQGPHPESQEQIVVYRVINLTDEAVLADANHPLADKVLNFAVTIGEIREATAEELEHGHVHTSDDGGCCDAGGGCC